MTAKPTHTESICRLCGTDLCDVLDLGSFALSDFVRLDQDVTMVPLVLAKCPTCGLVQLRHSVDRELMYRHYWYHSGLNPSMVESLRDIVRGVESRVELEPGDTVVDIGANDGTLLSLYTKPLMRIGYDPARNLAEKAEQNCDVFINDYFETSEEVLPHVKAVTSIAMFYDLDEPRRFVQRVREVLAPDGIWVLQMTDLVRMLQANAFDNICHEHVCYYSLGQIVTLLFEEGLSVFDVEFNDVNGASVRIYAAHTGAREVMPSVRRALEDESEYLRDDAIDCFADRVQQIRTDVVAFIERERACGKHFHALGASTKGNTLLQYFNLGPTQIECAAEVNPDKYGLHTAGTRIPIVPQAISLAQKPDYYLVLPWHFIAFFLRAREDYLEAGGILFVPLPEPKLYDEDTTWELGEVHACAEGPGAVDR